MADNSRELEILLKARNLTEEAFRAVERASEQLKDKQKKNQSDFDKMAESFGRFVGGQKESLEAIAKGAGIVGGAIGTAAAGIVALGVRGSTVISIDKSFQALARSVGDTGDEILKVTRGATKGLISDLDIMSSVNKGILLGLPLTAREMGTLSQTAIVLGKAMKQGPTESLNDLITGLGRGSPLILDNLGITINAAEAYKAYGASIGKSADELTDGEKKLAVYRSALDAAGKKVAELGGLQLTFADRITQGKVAVANTLDMLGKLVAKSPAVNAALEGIAGAAIEAFGVDQAANVQRWGGYVDRAAILLVGLASAAITTGRYIVDAFYGARYVLFGFLEAVTNIVYAMLDGNARIAEFMTKIPVLGARWKESAAIARAGADGVLMLAMSFEDTKKAALASKQASDSTFDAMSAGLDKVRASMVKAAAEGKSVETGFENAAAGAGKAGAAVATVSKQIEEWQKKAKDLNEALVSANRNGVASSVVLEQYGNAIADVVREGQVFGQVIPRAIESAYAALNGRELAEAQREWIEILQKFGIQSAAIARKQADEQMKIAGQTGAALANAFAARRTYEEKLADLTRSGVDQRLAALERERREAIDKLGAAPAGMEEQWRQSTAAVNVYYDALVKNLGDQSETVAGQIRGVASMLADAWGGVFGGLLGAATNVLDQIVARSSDKFSGLAGLLNSKFGKGLGIGLEGFGTGLGFGEQYGRGRGAAAGALSGAMTGAAAGSVIPGIGTVVGGVIGAAGGFLGGLFGGGKKAKAEREELAAIQKDLLSTFGSMENLRRSASAVGLSIDGAFSTRKPEEAKKQIERLNDALEAQRKRLDGISSAVDGINARAAAAESRLKAGGDAAAAEFDRIGQYAAAAFAGTVKETGDAIGALSALEPTFRILADAQKAAGFEASETLSKLLGFRELVGTNRDVADSVSSLNQIMKGLGDAGVTNTALFQTFGADAGAQIRLLTDRNVDLNQQMMLMQPTLQALWEGQKKFGNVTDESTAALLAQAEQQGIVGANMQSVNERILDVLLAIGDALGARIPAGLAATQAAAATSLGGVQRNLDEVRARAGMAADAVEGEFRNIQIPAIDVPFTYRATNDLPNLEVPEDEPRQGFAVGGTVPFTPGGRVVRVAERETERIVSDSQLEGILSRALAASGGSTRSAATPGVVVKIGERELRPMVVQFVRDALASGEIGVPRRNLAERGF